MVSEQPRGLEWNPPLLLVGPHYPEHLLEQCQGYLCVSSVLEVLHAGLLAQFLVALLQQQVPYLEVMHEHFIRLYFLPMKSSEV
jgi:hypothetical protein